MKKYERLTKWEDDRTASIHGYMDGEIQDAINRLAKLEDAIEKGTLVCFPLKRYDKVYCVLFPDQKYVWEREILNASYDFINEKLKIEDTQGIISFLGESAFLTKREAEEKLKSLMQDANNSI